MRVAIYAAVICLALGACATIPDEASAVRRGCAAMKDRFPDRRIDCADLTARPSADGHQWLVTERVADDALHQMGAAISPVTGRIFNVWGE